MKRLSIIIIGLLFAGNFMAATIRLLLFASLAQAQGAPENSEKLGLVKAGKLQEARADWWGFNETDSTKCLQDAIDSGVNKLIIPNMGKPWIVNPIALASDQEIFLEPGAVIEAIKGGFKGQNDSLFSASRKKNITISGKDAILRMHKNDYQDKAQYTPAEWRHAINLLSCENIKILGLTIMSSGGDGVYVGSCEEPMDYCKDIVIKDCVIDDNHRQGISVISVVNLLVENCVIKNTKGTDPQAGIDFEPNKKDQRLFGITVKDCVFENNSGAGCLILASPGPDTEPISFIFENCKAIGNKFMGGFGHNPPFSMIDMKMSNCTETVNGRTKVCNDFWKDIINQPIQTLDKQKQAIVDRVKRADVIGMKLKPLDEAAYKRAKKLSMPVLRGKSFFIVYAKEGEAVAFNTKLLRDYGQGMSLHLLAPSGKRNNIAQFSGKEGSQALSFIAKETGAQIIEFDPSGGWFEFGLEKTGPQGVAAQMLALDEPIHFFGESGLGTFYFYVPENTADFYVEVAGDDLGGERVKVSVYGPNGKLVETQDKIGDIAHKIVVSRRNAFRGEIWSLKTEKAADFCLEDFYIDLVGIPPILSLEKGSLLVPGQKNERKFK